MENNAESIKCEIQNGDSTKESEGYDFNETYGKSESKQIQAQSGTMNISAKIQEWDIYKCNVCFKSFKQKKYVEVHMRMHTGERPFSCQICNKSFPLKGSLTFHVNTQHSKDRELMCDQCDFTTVKEYTLKAHKRVHTGETFKCDKCPKEFTTSRNLNLHTLTHTGERKFQCDDCGKAFKRVDTLKLHKRVHTGERPYKCDECSKTFSRREQLVVHKGKHRGVKDFSCDMCP